MDYLQIKYLHISLALLTTFSFILRGYWMMVESDLLDNRWVKILPHVIDSALLASAVALVMLSGLYPFVFDWVTAKVLFLVAYIISGSIALKRGKTKPIRITAFFVALTCLAQIYYAAFNKFML